MSEQLLTVLKLCLLALLYLFFLRVLRAVWAELRAAPAPASPTPPPPAAPAAPAAPARRGRGAPSELVVTDPAERRGDSYPIGAEVTVGRGAGCAVSLASDTYVSTVHARVFRGDDGRMYVEDLGSTNGTYLNTAKVGAPSPLSRGDRLQVGNTVLEAR